MPRILSLARIDYDDWHAGLITRSPPRPLDAPDGAVIEDIGQDFEIVHRVSGHGEMNAVIVDDCEEYYLARVAE